MGIGSIEATYEAHELLEGLGVGGDEVGERDGHGDVDAELGDLKDPLGSSQRRHGSPPAAAVTLPSFLPPRNSLLTTPPSTAPPCLSLLGGGDDNGEGEAEHVPRGRDCEEEGARGDGATGEEEEEARPWRSKGRGRGRRRRWEGEGKKRSTALPRFPVR